MINYKHGWPETVLYFHDIPQMEKRVIHFPDKKPNKKDIMGHNLPSSSQRWRRISVPKKLANMQKAYSRKDLIKELLTNKRKYEDEWKHMEQMWKNRWEGYWFMNNGNITWITGNHWFYLNDWPIDGDYLDYRLTDQMYWIFVEEANDDPTCYGIIELTRRREGKSSRAGCRMYYVVTGFFNSMGGIQSKTDKDAVDMFAQTIKGPWKKLPIYFSPNFSHSSDPKTRMDFAKVATRGHNAADDMAEELEELTSWIDTRSSEELAFDSRKLHIYIGDEEGKTKEVNIYDRWGTVKKCLQGNQGTIDGFAIHTSTVEDMIKQGGANYLKLWKESIYSQKNAVTGQTKSGLWQYFLPAYMGYMYDSYGYPKIAESKAILLAERDEFKDDPTELAKIIRKNPWTPQEAFWIDQKDCNFNAVLLQKRISYLQFEGDRLVRRGRLEWQNGCIPFGITIGDPTGTFNYDGKVVFVEDPNGPFEVSHMYDNPKDYNKYFVNDGLVWPGNMDKVVAGSDPFKFKITKKNERSRGAGAAFLMHDPDIDPFSKPTEQWSTCRFIVTYLNRPADADIFAEDMLMMCVWLGCQMNPEINVPIVWEHFDKRGMSGYLYYDEDIRGKMSLTPGVNTLDPQKEIIYTLYQKHIQHHCTRECHLDLLMQCLEIEDDMGPFDLFAAGGMALKAAKKRKFQMEAEPVKIDTVVRRYSYKDRKTTVLTHN